MNITRALWTDAILFVTVIALCASAQNKRRHRNREKPKPAPLTGDTAADGDLTTSTTLKNATVDSKRKNNGYKMWIMDKYPDPQKQPRKCGRPRQPSFLCDPDRILSPTEADDVDRVLNETCAETTCSCQSCDSPWFQHDDDVCSGYKIAVGIAYQLTSSSTNDPDYMVKEGPRWAIHLREAKWKYGMCGDDVVILLVVSVAKVYTTAGHKAKELITAECITKAHKDTAEYLQDGKYVDVLVTMAKLYKSILKSGKNNVCKPDPTSPLHPAAIAVIALFSAFTVVIIISAICCVWGTCKNHASSGAKRIRRSLRGESDVDPSRARYDDDPGSVGYMADEHNHDGKRSMNMRESDSDYDRYDQYKESYAMTTSLDQMDMGRRGPSPLAHSHRDIKDGRTQVDISKHRDEHPLQRNDYMDINS